MKKKLIVTTLIMVLVGLLGAFVAQNTNISLWLRDPGYRIAVALEKEFPFVDVWEIRSDGDFVYVSILWLETPEQEAIHQINDAVEAYLNDYLTGENRVVFKDIILDGDSYIVVSMLSCPTKDIGTGEPVYCQIWPWPLQTKPEAYPWVGPSSLL